MLLTLPCASPPQAFELWAAEAKETIALKRRVAAILARNTGNVVRRCFSAWHQMVFDGKVQRMHAAADRADEKRADDLSRRWQLVSAWFYPISFTCLQRLSLVLTPWWWWWSWW